MNFAPTISAKPSIFTRIYFSIGIIAFSLMPLVFAVTFLGDDDSTGVVDLEMSVLAIVGLQGMLWFAQRRCGTPERPYWRSLLVVASCFSTGWTYLNIIFVPAALVVTMSISCVLAFASNAPQRMSRLVYWFYDHRMRQ
jgi:hypothetical protein